MKILFGVLVLCFSVKSFAGATYINVTDASQLKYQMASNGKVFFRNLHAFKETVTGCCYAFVLDITTDFGKALWSTILMKMATKESIYLRVSESNPPTSGDPASITHAGNW